jgi:hypothetical protein
MDLGSIVTGVVLTLIASWFTVYLTQAKAQKERKEEFRSLLILLNWQVQKIAAQAAPTACPLELKMPAYGMLLDRGFFARLPTQLRDHLLCLEIGIEGTNRANALLWRGSEGIAPQDRETVLKLLRNEVENNLIVVRTEAASVLAAFGPLFKRLRVADKASTEGASPTDANDTAQGGTGDKQTEKPLGYVGMRQLTDAVRRGIEQQNWYASLALALALPDICGFLEAPDVKSQPRYVAWCNRFLEPGYTHEVGANHEKHTFLYGEDCYALRCAFLHEGDDDVTRQKARKALDSFLFVEPPATGRIHCNQSNGKLQLQVDIFCRDVCDGVDQWTEDVLASDREAQARTAHLLVIHSLAQGLSF